MERAATVEEAFEECPYDFCGYLARRLGVERRVAARMVGDWMRRYEPAAGRSNVEQPSAPRTLEQSRAA